jgi:uncharacterized protein (DUF305 family)
MRRLFRYSALLAVAGAASLVLAACGGTDQPGAVPTPTTAPTSTPDDFNDADVAFTQMMIPHHVQAVEMAELAATRASDPELKRLAADIKGAQDPEIATMVGWLRGLGQPTEMPGGHEGHGGMPGMMSEEDMAELTAAKGVDFDRRFARMMISHHNGAIQMCQDIAVSGNHADVKGLAATIQQTQAAEVAQLEKILDRL